METYSETIGRFAGELKLADVPAAVVEKAKLVFLDTIGIALASSTMDFGLMAINVARKLGGPKASLLIGTSDRVAAANAVIANGTLAHGLDYRSEERRVGKECRSWWSACHQKKNDM